MMKRMSFSETIFLFVLALIIFGPKKLPEIARQVGKYMNEFKRASNEFKAQIEQEISNLEVETSRQFCRPARLRKALPAALPIRRLLEISGADGSVAQLAAAEAHATEVHAAEAASDDEPLFAASASAVAPSPTASPSVASSDHVTPPTTQESHV